MLHKNGRVLKKLPHGNDLFFGHGGNDFQFLVRVTGNDTCGSSSLQAARDLRNVLFLLFLNLAALLVYHTVVLLLLEQKKAADLLLENHLLTMQQLQYDNLQQRIDEARQARHDVRHHALLSLEYLRSGKFQAEFKFSGDQPANIRTGQTYYLNLQLGQPESAVLIPRGTFYQKTGGKWIYVVSPDGGKAVKREIRIGRQNPQYYEVLEGLEPGEKVITSGYDNFGDNEVLVF